MTESHDNLFRRGSLAHYPWNKRLLIHLADRSLYALVAMIGSTIRFSVTGEENMTRVESTGKVPIFCFWHDQIMPATYFYRGRGVVVITSQSFDGEYIARFITRFGYGAIRGSSSRGGSRALIEMIRAMKEGHPMAFTIDGPRGPRHIVKPGPVLLAKKTGNPIVPATIEPAASYRLSSWDQMQIPRPFTTGLVIYGRPIYVSSDASDVELEDKRLEVQKSLDDLLAEAAKWRAH